MMPSLDPQLLHDIGERIRSLDRQQRPLTAPVLAIDTLQAALDQASGLAGKAENKLALRGRLIDLIAQACRALRDQGLQTSGDAFTQDCPF